MIRSLTLSDEPDDQRIAELQRVFTKGIGDEQLLREVLPRLPQAVLEACIEHDIDGFRMVLCAFDELVSMPLPFDYCDVVADFYERIFHLTDDVDTCRIILRRLPTLAEAHNRWHVGEVFARIVATVQRTAQGMMARDALLAAPPATQWCAPYLRQHSPLPIINDALGEVCGA